MIALAACFGLVAPTTGHAETVATQVADLNSGPAGSDISNPTVFDHALFFDATVQGPSGAVNNLYKVEDGSAPQLVMQGDSSGPAATDFIIFDGSLFFDHTDTTDGPFGPFPSLRAYRIDSADSTPVLVDQADHPNGDYLALGSEATIFDGALVIPTAVADSMFSSHGALIKITSAEAAPAVMADYPLETSAPDILRYDGSLFVLPRHGSGNGDDGDFILQRYDSVNSGPELVIDAGPGITEVMGMTGPPTPYGEKLYTLGDSLIYHASTDGTVDGYKDFRLASAHDAPTQVTNILPAAAALDLNASAGFPGALGRVFAMNGVSYFAGSDPSDADGTELYKADGTTDGWSEVADINPGSADSSPGGLGGNLIQLGGKLYFAANDGTHGFEIFESDGTAGGTQILGDINPGSDDGILNALFSGAPAAVNGKLYFAAFDQAHGNEVWRSDGTTAGTELVADIVPGSEGSNPANFISLDGTVYFTAATEAYGDELYRLDTVTPPPPDTGNPSPTGSEAALGVSLKAKAKLQRGKKTNFVVRIANTDTGTASGVRVCLRVDRRAVRLRGKCKNVGVLPGGSAVKRVFHAQIRGTHSAGAYHLNAVVSRTPDSDPATADRVAVSRVLKVR